MSESRGIGLTAERVTMRTLGSYTTPEGALLCGYITAAYFADGDEEWEDDKDWSADAILQAKADCAKFLAKAAPWIDSYCRSINIPLAEFEWLRWYDQAGHDFWMTRNEHDVGFRDGDWDIELSVSDAFEVVVTSGDESASSKLSVKRRDKFFSDALTAISKTFRSIDLYLGDDDLLYFI